MRGKNSPVVQKRSRCPHIVVKERLSHDGIELANFYFRYGANIYVLTYEKNGRKKHTFIDTGYADHQRLIFPILEENGICLKNIENIIITHRHPDHSGLAALLAEESGSNILVHAGFRDFVDGNISPMERKWLGNFDPARLATCNMTYLESDGVNGAVTIGGVDFPRMGPGVEIGEGCRLEIITCPESDPTHSPDQLLILYSPRNTPYTCETPDENFRPTDEIIFSGDLWLMRGPIFERRLRSLGLSMKFVLFRFMDFIFRRKEIRSAPQEQDAKAKDAIKNGFCLIRVKPGHGREFLGSNIIPKTLMADRDLLVHLGYSPDEDKSELKSDHLLSRIAMLQEEAYKRFVDTLNVWMNLGYSRDEITDLLVRIYMEQSGGGKLVAQDRKERRIRLKNTLGRLESERIESDDLYWIAKSTLSELNRL